MTRIQNLVLLIELLLLTLGTGSQTPARAATPTERPSNVQPSLVEGSAPWLEGEALEYQIQSLAGEPLGALTLWAETAELDGIEAWRLEKRTVLSSDLFGYGVSRTLADRQTLRPIRSSLRHGILGHADASYEPAGVKIRTGAGTTHLDSHQELYDNNQLLYIVRMLPLEVGYHTRLDLLPLWTASVVETHLEVTDKGSCLVPAGSFECFEIDLGSERKLWISSGTERYPVRIQEPGRVVELSTIGEIDPWASTQFELEELGVTGTLPPAWRARQIHRGDPARRAVVRFLDPNAESTGTLDVRNCAGRSCLPILETAEQDLAEVSLRLDGGQLREGSWTTRAIDGQETIAFQADFLRDEEPWVRYHLYIHKAGKRLELTFQTPAAHLEHLQPAFDWITNHLEVERTWQPPTVALAR